ncbi:MAG: hypothetical protein AUI42_01460 [Actinobacteria bacterium 13_1_40CM_2_65_8]|nr:MAG: hypothetical protein AUI42_01460 [Actinobacteria bacterium 13_1_40CM_2_65_8]
MLYQVGALRHLADDHMYQHRPAEAAECLDRALELSQASGERWNRSELSGMRARAALEMGDLPAADELIDRAIASLREYDVTAISEVQQSLGMIRAAQGREQEAESALRWSLEVFSATQFNWNKVDPALALARFLAKRGDADEASELIDTYESWAHDRGIVLWDREFEEIRALIAG